MSETVETVTLERIKVGVAQMISREILDDVDVTVEPNWPYDQIIIHAVRELTAAPRQDVTAEVVWPLSWRGLWAADVLAWIPVALEPLDPRWWWRALMEERGLPVRPIGWSRSLRAWILDRVRLGTRSETESLVPRICPHIAVPGHQSHVQFLLYDQKADE